MCNSCYCENIEKCSIRGFIPSGGCCPNCEMYNPLDLPCNNQFEKAKTREFIPIKELILSEDIF